MQVVADQFPKKRLAEDEFVVPEPDPRSVDATDHLEAEFEVADDRIAEDEGKQRNQRRHVEIGYETASLHGALQDFGRSAKAERGRDTPRGVPADRT